MRRARNLAPDDTVYFLELLHKVGFCLQTSRRVYDHDVDAARLCRLHRVEYDRSGVGALRMFDHLRVRAVPPNLQLVDRRRTEGVRSSQKNSLPLPSIICTQFADGRCLADAVGSDYK